MRAGGPRPAGLEDLGLPRSRLLPAVFVLLHINLLSPKTYAFALQAEALFEGDLSIRLDKGDEVTVSPSFGVENAHPSPATIGQGLFQQRAISKIVNERAKSDVGVLIIVTFANSGSRV